uniref:Uncharacterized protein n=1 Tax=Glossina pallidipes TaxID=7398 RepID=A0A1A9Z9Q3_GLOPL
MDEIVSEAYQRIHQLFSNVRLYSGPQLELYGNPVGILLEPNWNCNRPNWNTSRTQLVYHPDPIGVLPLPDWNRTFTNNSSHLFIGTMISMVIVLFGVGFDS